MVLRTVDLGQIYLAHATVYRTAGPVRTVSMYSSVVVLPHTTSMTAWISARLGRQPSRTLSATAVITMRRCSAVSPSKRSGQRCSHVEASKLRIATILLFRRPLATPSPTSPVTRSSHAYGGLRDLVMTVETSLGRTHCGFNEATKSAAQQAHSRTRSRESTASLNGWHPPLQ